MTWIPPKFGSLEHYALPSRVAQAQVTIDHTQSLYEKRQQWLKHQEEQAKPKQPQRRRRIEQPLIDLDKRFPLPDMTRKTKEPTVGLCDRCTRKSVHVLKNAKGVHQYCELHSPEQRGQR